MRTKFSLDFPFAMGRPHSALRRVQHIRLLDPS